MVIEYTTAYVPRMYSREDMQHMNPMSDTLKKMGDDGWQLCAVGSPDSAHTVCCYFSRIARTTCSPKNKDYEKQYLFDKYQNLPNKQWYEITDQGYFDAGWDAAVRWMSFHAIAKLIEEQNNEARKKT